MNDGAYLPLPDLDAYLDRIGISKAEDPTPDFLDKLIYAHQCTVPFENLDVYEKHLEPSLAIPDLFDKIVTRKRGGYCFEMNGLFVALLKAAGFDVYPGMARVFLRPDPHPILSHRVSIVRFSNTLRVADVGFGGPMPGFAPIIADGFTRTEHGQTFTIRAHSEHWWDVRYTNSDGVESVVLRICTVPSEESDFLALSYFQSQWPESTFRTRRLANIRTECGSRSLINSSYTEHNNGDVTTRELADDSSIDQVLSEKFGIVGWR